MERSEGQEEEQKQRGGGGGSPLKKEEEEEEENIEENIGEEEGEEARWLRHNSPLFQVVVIGVVCFCCPGMFNALSGMGGGGQLDHRAANNANTALYAAFSVSGVLGGAAYNLLGPGSPSSSAAPPTPSTPPPSSTTTTTRAASSSPSSPAASSAPAPASSGPRRAPSSPPPRRPASRPPTSPSSGPSSTPAASSAASSPSSSTTPAPPPPPPSATPPTSPSSPSWPAAPSSPSPSCPLPRRPRRRLPPLRRRLLPGRPRRAAPHPPPLRRPQHAAHRPRRLGQQLLLHLPVQPRQRRPLRPPHPGLNNVFYWGAQMIGSAAVGYLLDFSFPGRRRRLRGFLGSPPIDFKQGRRFGGPFVLYFSYGLLDAMFQTLCYWVIGALADDSQTLSRYSGFYKGVQSAGAAVAWQIDTRNVSAMSQLIVNWSLTTISYPLLAVLVALAVKDETSPQDAEKNIPNPPPSAAAAAAAAAPPSISVGDGGEQGNNREAKSS
uniref:UNC93-like protein 1 n=1 Tax=Ananas comosus var. bracteatus TaxID=296719 RepID=A0A6V7QL45_ANACO|nr:unnamed protein product [Ananas comosus var. bracteatus]